jgi:predicted transport protein
MQELGDDVNVVYRGNYISFRKKNPFADVILYQKGLYIVINMKKGNLKDPDNLTKDFSVGGHWGNGDYQVLIDNKSVDLDSVMYLVKQSYQHQD